MPSCIIPYFRVPALSPFTVSHHSRFRRASCLIRMKVAVHAQMATKTGRSVGSRQHRRREADTDKHVHDDSSDQEEEDAEKSQEDSAPPSPRCLSRDDVLAALGYRSGNLQQPSATTQPSHAQRPNACRRCGKKVYPLELIDIGDCYHRGCFKCLVSASAVVFFGFSVSLHRCGCVFVSSKVLCRKF